MNRSDQLLTELAHLLGLPALAFDEHRLCGFLLDGQYRITLLANSEELLYLYALLGEWPARAEASLPMELMTANLIFSRAHGPYIGYDPTTNTLLLSKAIALEGIQANDLKRIVEQLAQQQAHMLKVFEKHTVTLQQPPLLISNFA